MKNTPTHLFLMTLAVLSSTYFHPTSVHASSAAILGTYFGNQSVVDAPVPTSVQLNTDTKRLSFSWTQRGDDQLTAVWIHGTRVGNPPSYTVSIHPDDSNDVPDTSTNLGGSEPETPSGTGWTKFSFLGPADLSDGARYHAVIQSDGGADSNNYYAVDHFTNPLHGLVPYDQYSDGGFNTTFDNGGGSFSLWDGTPVFGIELSTPYGNPYHAVNTNMVFGTSVLSQVFQGPAGNPWVNSVGIYVQRNGSPAGALQFILTDITGGVTVSSGTLATAGTTNTALGWIDVALPNAPVQLNGTHIYRLILGSSTSGSIANYQVGMLSNPDVISPLNDITFDGVGSYASQSTDGGNAWTNFLYADLPFRFFIVPAPTPTATPSPTRTSTWTHSFTRTPSLTGSPTSTDTPTLTPVPPTATPSATFASPPPSDCAGFGATTAGVYPSAVSGSALRLAKHTLSSASAVTAVAFHMAFDGPISGSSARSAIYSDVAGAPGTLIAQSPVTYNLLQQGWNIVQIPQTVLPAGVYWLAAYVDVSGTLYNFTGTVGAGLAATGNWSTTAPPVFTGTFASSYIWAFVGLCGPMPTDTPTITLSPTPVSTSTSTWTLENTPTHTLTPPIPTDTPSPTITPTSSLTWTSTHTLTPTSSFTETLSWTPSPTWTPTPSLTSTTVMTSTASLTPTPDGSISLSTNQYNPATGPLGLNIRVEQPGPVRVKVYNVGGEAVMSLRDQTMSPGSYRVNWDGRNSEGAVVGNGLYLVMVETVSSKRFLKVIVVK